MKEQSTLMTGSTIKQDNGSGYRLSQAFPGRRFHDETLYAVRWTGVDPDCSNITSIHRAPKSALRAWGME